MRGGDGGTSIWCPSPSLLTQIPEKQIPPPTHPCPTLASVPFFVIISHCHAQTEACEYTTQINDTHPEVAAVASVALTAISRNGVFNFSHFIFTPLPPNFHIHATFYDFFPK